MMDKVHAFKRYLRWFGATVLLASVGVVGFVILVDPYGLYGHILEHASFNLVKPGLSRYQNEIKLTHAVALGPDVLIFGNSRAEIGFDPDGFALADKGVSAYNLAISGSGISNARGQLEYLERIGSKPKLIVLGVEFLDFIDASGKRPSLTLAFAPRSALHPVERRFWRFDSLFSLTSLQDALRTLFIQGQDDPETTTARGFNPLKEYRAKARNEGYYGIFRQRAEENAKAFLKKAKGVLSMTDFIHLDAILVLAAQSDIEVRLVIYPYHAQMLALFEATGLWPTFQQWKQGLTQEISSLRQRYPAARVELFDFSGYSAYACERIPDQGDHKTITKWYWEGGHFKKELGEFVLGRVLSKSETAFTQISGSVFGVRLEQQNELENQRRIADERMRCLRDYPALFNESAALVTLARKRLSSR